MSDLENKKTDLKTVNDKQSNTSIAENNKEQLKKKKKKKCIIYGIIIALFLIGGGVWFYLEYTKKLKSFAGVEKIDDSMDISLQNVQDILARLQGVQAIGAIIDGGNIIEDIASFRAAFEANKNALLASNDSVIAIPAIGVKFGLASSEPLSTELVKEYATYFLQTDQSATILVEGYTCDLGDNLTNMELSKNRANVVKQILLDCGVPETCIEVKWHGESKYNSLGYQNKEDHRRVNISIK